MNRKTTYITIGVLLLLIGLVISFTIDHNYIPVIAGCLIGAGVGIGMHAIWFTSK